MSNETDFILQTFNRYIEGVVKERGKEPADPFCIAVIRAMSFIQERTVGGVCEIGRSELEWLVWFAWYHEEINANRACEILSINKDQFECLNSRLCKMLVKKS